MYYYFKNFVWIENSDNIFDCLDDFQNVEGFGYLEYFVLEWNVCIVFDVDLGMEYVFDLIVMMQQMVEQGVDQVLLWGIIYKNLLICLGCQYNDFDVLGGIVIELIFVGEVMIMMLLILLDICVIDLDWLEDYIDQIGMLGVQ